MVDLDDNICIQYMLRIINNFDKKKLKLWIILNKNSYLNCRLMLIYFNDLLGNVQNFCKRICFW